MVVLTVMYPNTDGSKFDLDYYLNKHMPLVHERMGSMGLTRSTVVKGVSAGGPGGSAPYQIMTHLFFESADAMAEAMQTHGAEVVGDIVNFTDVEAISQISEPIQETGG